MRLLHLDSRQSFTNDGSTFMFGPSAGVQVHSSIMRKTTDTPSEVDDIIGTDK